MLEEYGPLIIFSMIIISGILISSPLGKSMKFPFTDTRRMLLGLVIVETGTLLTSMWTEVIHREIAATGGTNFCAADGLVQCGSVIGDPKYSEFFGISWGMIGMVSFSILLFLAVSLFFGPRDKMANIWLSMAFLLSLPGLIGVAWLVIVELFLVDGAPHICPYCTVVHVGMVATVVILYVLRNQNEEGRWDIS